VVVPGTRSYRVGRIIRDSHCIPEEASVSSSRVPAEPPFLEPGSATVDDLVRLDLRIGRIVKADLHEGARRPAYRLLVDFGAAGTRRSSAQLAGTYPDPAALVGRLVVAVVNLPPRRVAGFSSEVLVLGALAPDGRIPLLGVDEGAEPGQRVA
jgi:tRNA-binding protein